MDLYLVRHAIAYERDSMRWPNDQNRPLTASGEDRFRSGAAGLARLTGTVDAVLSSGLTRAWQTALILQQYGGFPEPQRCTALEPGHSAEQTVRALDDYRDMNSIVLIGHEPMLSDLAGFLLAGPGSDLYLEMRKGGAACLRLEDLIPGQAILRWWLMPKMLRMYSRA